MSIRLEALPGLALFACVVRNGSMSGAAQELGLSRSAVSKQLSKFEQQLGARLLQRTTRTLALTELGEEIWREAQAVELALTNVEAITDGYRQHVRGRLKVSCSSSIGRTHLLPLLPQFMQQYPDVDLILLFEDRMVDLAAEQIDIAIRIGHLPDSSLIARKLGELEWQLVASPKYLAIHGTPTTPQALTQHNCLCYRNNTRAMDVWRFRDDEQVISVQVHGSLAMNDAGALVDAACHDHGVLLIDRALLGPALASGQLLPLLSEYPPAPGLPVYAVYPAREWLPAKTSAMVDFLLESFAPRLISRDI